MTSLQPRPADVGREPVPRHGRRVTMGPVEREMPALDVSTWGADLRYLGDQKAFSMSAGKIGDPGGASSA